MMKVLKSFCSFVESLCKEEIIMIEVIKHIDDQIDLISMKNEQLEVVVSNYGCTIIKSYHGR